MTDLRRAFIDDTTGDIYSERHGTADVKIGNVLSGVGFAAYVDDETPTLDQHSPLVFDATTFNVGGRYDTGTGIWTPPAGLVLMTAYITFLAETEDYKGTISIQKNNGEANRTVTWIVTAAGGEFGAGIVTWLDLANGTDYYSVYAGPSGVAMVGGGDSSNANSFFSGVSLSGQS